jgi:probable rRNA maturation factor
MPGGAPAAPAAPADDGGDLMSIEVNDESGQGVDGERVESLARFVLGRLKVHPQAELSVLAVDVATMSSLHQQWMDEEGPTDVLSFPMDELRPGKEGEEPEPGLLGDVVLCPEVAATQASAAGHSTAEELDLLTTHGILHLLGYDHAEPDEEREMFGLQSELLQAWSGARSGSDG